MHLCRCWTGDVPITSCARALLARGSTDSHCRTEPVPPRHYYSSWHWSSRSSLQTCGRLTTPLTQLVIISVEPKEKHLEAATTVQPIFSLPCSNNLAEKMHQFQFDVLLMSCDGCLIAVGNCWLGFSKKLRTLAELRLEVNQTPGLQRCGKN